MSSFARMKPRSALLLIAGIISLSACSGAPRSDSYTSRIGAATTLDSDRESCMRTCNADYVRCADTDAARRNIGGNEAADLFGAAANCKQTLKNCLPRCKGR